ncbi:MAG: SdrD B-like domain-containing protein [Planctomycetota bacterium]
MLNSRCLSVSLVVALVAMTMGFTGPNLTAQNFTSGFASSVVSSDAGSGGSNDSPSNALGDDLSTFYRLGYGGNLVVAFDELICNSGDSDPEICICEEWDNECYYICLDPADDFTEAALIAAGVGQFGDFFELGILYCGNVCFDIDADLLPGFGPGELQFASVMIVAASGDTPEIQLLSSDYLCDPTPPTVFAICADVIVDYTPGSTSHTDTAVNSLGAPDGDWTRLGSGGCLALGVSGSTISTSGNATADLNVLEVEPGLGVDNYWLDLKPADAATLAAVVAAGLPLINDGFYQAGNFTGTQEIDLDAIIPGFAAGDLNFDCIRICDTPGGNASGSAEIDAVCFLSTIPALPDLAKIGDFVFEDLDRDGIQDSGEPGIEGVTVTLLDGDGNALGVSQLSDENGAYLFCVEAGSYIVCFAPVAGMELTSANEGDDDENSDANPATGKTAVITVALGDINLDIDAGYRCIQAIVDTNFPACGLANDPVLDSTPAIPGQSIAVTMDSVFPNAVTFGFLSLGAPTPWVVPGSSCTVYLDPVTPNNFILIWADITDSAGDFTAYFPIPEIPGIEGFQFTLQARVCEPSVPGPIPGTPDWISNGISMTVGCP